MLSPRVFVQSEHGRESGCVAATCDIAGRSPRFVSPGACFRLTAGLHMLRSRPRQQGRRAGAAISRGVPEARHGRVNRPALALHFPSLYTLLLCNPYLCFASVRSSCHRIVFLSEYTRNFIQGKVSQSFYFFLQDKPTVEGNLAPLRKPPTRCTVKVRDRLQNNGAGGGGGWMGRGAAAES